MLRRVHIPSSPDIVKEKTSKKKQAKNVRNSLPPLSLKGGLQEGLLSKRKMKKIRKETEIFYYSVYRVIGKSFPHLVTLPFLFRAIGTGQKS